jgi:hypothetical protein
MNALQQQFLNPPEEFTPIPFWFWNDHLTKEEISRQINDFYRVRINHLIIKVTNNRANEMDDARLQSGLIGPVSFEISY